jgi:hypothetical protein
MEFGTIQLPSSATSMQLVNENFLIVGQATGNLIGLNLNTGGQDILQAHKSNIT